MVSLRKVADPLRVAEVGTGALGRQLGEIIPDPFPYPAHPAVGCVAQTPRFACTLADDHVGPHVAHGTGGVVVALWPR